ncbi:hypothetical protein K458DRAFT_399454 [Lentithecium fluviatile CBS 122367]|uniref:MARVEL domain-containing protein n=1 Tax=Lentithecium fluviatile CBS 122367 TaxID=1168545 RepID=A0A6G1JHM4_9PLEO|nr:hypothetical protein K458DRAFT_399454 [Lentithecium fluviatile CBS 122367]
MAASTVQWKKRILLPIWILRIVAMLFICVVFGIAIAYVKQNGGSSVSLGVVIFFYLLIIAVLLLDVLQILMLLNHNLSPIGLLIINGIQTTFWTSVLLMDITYIAKERSTATGLIMSLSLSALFFATFLYAIIMFIKQRREAKRGQYAPAHNPANTMPNLAPTPYTGPAIQHHSTAYHSPMRDNGDLGAQNIPYPPYGGPPSYYAEPPAKPANMV